MRLDELKVVDIAFLGGCRVGRGWLQMGWWVGLRVRVAGGWCHPRAAGLGCVVRLGSRPAWAAGSWAGGWRSLRVLGRRATARLAAGSSLPVALQPTVPLACLPWLPHTPEGCLPHPSALLCCCPAARALPSSPRADGCAAPTIAVLYEDTKEQRHVKTYEVSLREKVRDGCSTAGQYRAQRSSGTAGAAAAVQ